MEPSCQAQSPSEDMDFPSAIFYVFLVIGAIVVFISAIVIVRINRQSKTGMDFYLPFESSFNN